MTKFLANIMEMARVETGEINARREKLHCWRDIVEAAISRVPGAMYAGVNIADGRMLMSSPIRRCWNKFL